MNTATLVRTLLASCAFVSLGAGALAQEFDYGSFEGYNLQVKLIGGTQYERLYTRIPEWEEMTGATVEIVSSKNHFDLTWPSASTSRWRRIS